MATHINVKDTPRSEVHSMIDYFTSIGYVFRSVKSRGKDVVECKNTLVVNNDERIIYMDGVDMADSISYDEYKKA